ncbi:MAG: transcription factor S [Thermoplasmatales archaeon]|nr:transcription factor S [Thermoplasmatales archaeon]
MFCQKCGSLLYPKGNELICKKCGYSQKKEDKKVVVSRRRESEAIVIEEEIALLPKTSIICPKCGNNEAYWLLRQTRAADEPETRIYICTKCNNRWREY